MSHRRFAVVVITVLVLCGGVLSACAPAGAPAPAAQPQIVEVTKIVQSTPIVQKVEVVVTPTPEPQATEAPKPKGKITLWGWSYDVMQSTGLVDEFKKLYPDIELDFVTYKAGDLYQNLQLALAAGQGAPDVVQVENSHLAGYVDQGGLADLTKQVTPYLDKMNAYKWIDAEKDGKYYAMPWDSGPVVMYYRRDVFEKAGLPTEPISVTQMVSTWDGYLNVCKTVKAKTGLSCFANSKANNDARLYEIALWQQGLGYYDKDGKITVDSPENIATLEKFGEFWKAGVTSEETPWTDGWYAELQSPDKPVASIVEASWLGVFLKTWIAGDTAGKWGVAYMPALKEGQTRAANDGGSTLAIPEQSKNKDAAWAFIEYMLGKEDSQLKQFAYSDFLPALETTYDSPLFIEPDPFFKGQVTRQVYLDVAQQVPAARVYGPKYQLMNGLVATAVQKYATGSMSAADALKEAADAIRQQTGMK